MTTKTCPVCGKDFEDEKGHQIYCSKECSKKAWVQRNRPPKTPPIGTELVCAYCGKLFIKRAVNQRYCCPECSREAQKAQHRLYYTEHAPDIIAQKRAHQLAKKMGELNGLHADSRQTMERIYANSHVDELAAEAERRGISYGQLQAEKWLKAQK